MKTKYLLILKKSLVEFVDDVIHVLPKESDLILARLYIDNQVDIQEVMEYLIAEMVPLEDLIKKRNDKFFLENNVLFEGLKKGSVNHFKSIWKSDLIDDDDRRMFWEWADLILKIVKLYYNSK